MGNVRERRKETVILSTCETVVVKEWGWTLMMKCLPMLGELDRLKELALASVRDEDKLEVEKMGDEDLLRVANAATKLNMTPGLLQALSEYSKTIKVLALPASGEATEKKEV